MDYKLSFEQAKEIAWEHVKHRCRRHIEEFPPILLLDEIIDVEWAIIFPWASKRQIDENNDDYAFIGNVPILVDLIDGTHLPFNSIMLSEDFTDFNALKNYAAQKGYPWDKSLEDYLNEQGCYPYPPPQRYMRNFPHRLKQYVPNAPSYEKIRKEVEI